MYYTYHTYYMYYTVRITLLLQNALPRDAAACSLHGAIHSAAAAGCSLLSSLQAARCWCDCCYCRLLLLQAAAAAACRLRAAAGCKLQAAGCRLLPLAFYGPCHGVCVCVRAQRAVIYIYIYIFIYTYTNTQIFLMEYWYALLSSI